VRKGDTIINLGLVREIGKITNEVDICIEFYFQDSFDCFRYDTKAERDNDFEYFWKKLNK
jgi:hypothetical protein